MGSYESWGKWAMSVYKPGSQHGSYVLRGIQASTPSGPRPFCSAPFSDAFGFAVLETPTYLCLLVWDAREVSDILSLPIYLSVHPFVCLSFSLSMQTRR